MKTPEEQALIAWCESKFNGYLSDDYSLNTVKAAFLAGHAVGLAADRWIRVEEKLPKEFQLVLVCNKKCLHPTYGRYIGQGNWRVNDEPDFSLTHVECISFVTHWQNLPALPKEEKGK